MKTQLSYTLLPIWIFFSVINLNSKEPARGKYSDSKEREFALVFVSPTEFYSLNLWVLSGVFCFFAIFRPYRTIELHKFLNFGLTTYLVTYD
jgi:hypothetical protein